jgi:hypothetical protein
MRFSNIYSKVRFIPQVHLFLLDHGTALDNHVIPLVVVPVMRSLTLSLQLVLAVKWVGDAFPCSGWGVG